MFKINDHILFENDDFVAVNKPAGMLSIPDRHNDQLPSLYQNLLKEREHILVVHRLDRETSGIILFAKNETTHRHLSMQFQERHIEKYYVGLVMGILSEKSGIVDKPIGEHPRLKGKMIIDKKGKPAKTEYEVLEEFGMYSYLKWQIHTGKTHQIRLHMKSLEHPLAVDELYGNGQPVFLSAIKKNYHLSKNEHEERPLLSRLALHAHQLSFKGPDGETYQLEAPLPKDLSAVLNQLHKNA